MCSIGAGSEDCVDLFRLSSRLPGDSITLYEGDKARMIVLEDVKVETVTIGIPALTSMSFAQGAESP